MYRKCQACRKYDNIYAAIGVHPDDYERLERGETPWSSAINDNSYIAGSFMDWLKRRHLRTTRLLRLEKSDLIIIMMSREESFRKVVCKTVRAGKRGQQAGYYPFKRCMC